MRGNVLNRLLQVCLQDVNHHVKVIVPGYEPMVGNAPISDPAIMKICYIETFTCVIKHAY